MLFPLPGQVPAAVPFPIGGVVAIVYKTRNWQADNHPFRCNPRRASPICHIIQGRAVQISSADRAYAEIRGLILSGDASPGTPLREEALADIVGVSRTPIREALRRLEAELYAVRTPGGRLVVADWDVDDVAEMFALRAMLEGHAAARAARRMTPEQLSELKDCNARIEAAIALPQPDIARFLAENRRFHDHVLAASASPRLTTMLAGLVEQPIVRRTATRYARADLERSAHEHGQLIQAFAARDGDWARAVMTAHIHRALHAFRDASPSK
jgi:DNA-binding GntR family transcriptional regulator